MLKKIPLLLLSFLLILALGACNAPADTDPLAAIRQSPAARLEAPDGTQILVDSEIALLRSFADFRIQPAPLEPADGEEDWLCRIIFNPAETVKGGEEITVSFHRDYLQINSEFYLPEPGVPYDTLLTWAEGKLVYFREQ